MTERFLVAVVGSGPAGLAAAARAALRGIRHVLLEKAPHHADTLQHYQKGKFVMSAPEVPPLRSDLTFGAGSRETILETWRRQITEVGINVRYGAEVASIRGTRGDFSVSLGDGSTVSAEHVVLAIGLQGNIRPLTAPGAGWEGVQYQLDDPDEYENETIVVVGAGDAAIENAVALAKMNRVVIVNRRDEFARAKSGNLTQDGVTQDGVRSLLCVMATNKPRAPTRANVEACHSPMEIIAVSSGSTGEPAAWPRSLVDELGIAM
jgi:thioredoxin reductase